MLSSVPTDGSARDLLADAGKAAKSEGLRKLVQWWRMREHTKAMKTAMKKARILLVGRMCEQPTSVRTPRKVMR